MLKAWPNQNTPSNIMNMRGITSAASAISEPVLSCVTLLRRECFMSLCQARHTRNSIPHYSQSQCHAVRDLQRLGIIQRNFRSRRTKCEQRQQQMADIAERLPHPTL